LRDILEGYNGLVNGVIKKLELFDSDYTLGLKMEDYGMLNGINKKLAQRGSGGLLGGEIKLLVEDIDGVLK
jgi:hypothetical protein